MRRASTNVRWNRIAELNAIVVSLVALGLFALPAGASSSSTSDSAAVHHADVGGVGSGALDVVSCSSDLLHGRWAGLQRPSAGGQDA